MSDGIDVLEQPLLESHRGGDVTSSFGKVPVTVQVILGSTRIPLNILLSLKQGSLVQLDEKLGEPVGIVVNGCKIAMGELFVLDGTDDKLGVKITELLSAQSKD